MTYSPAAQLSVAKSYIGFHEGPNNKNPFTLWQTGYTSTQPWCDSFVCFCAYQAGYRFPTYSLFGQKGDWNVGSHHQHAIQEGIWRDRNYRAASGDLIVLDFGIPDQHIEMVSTDMGAGFYPRCITIGGNTGDAVMWRSRYSANITGFIALTQSRQVGPVPPKPVPIPAPLEVEMQSVVDEGRPGEDDTHPRTINIDAKGHIIVNNGIKLKHRGVEVKVVKIGSRWVVPPAAGDDKLEYQGHVPRYDSKRRVVGVRQFFWDKNGLHTRDYDFFQ